MQTKKKLPAKNAAREHATSRSCRQQRKVSERGQLADKKVTDLITSSARKQRFVQVSSGIVSKKCRDTEATNNLKTRYILSGDETEDICLALDAVDGASINHKGCNNITTQRVLETIFSPSYHNSKDGGISDRVDVIELFNNDEQRNHLDCGSEETKVNMLDCLPTLGTSNSSEIDEQTKAGKNVNMEESRICPDNMNVDSMCYESDLSNIFHQQPATESIPTSTHSDEEDSLEGKFSSEVSAIYLAMQQSKLECIDEQSQDSMPTTEAFVEADEDDEIDDFDPYLFIRNLPELSAVVPAFRPMLLPKQTRSCPPTTLVLDLDETLVHSTLEHCVDADFTFPVNFNFKEHTVYVRCRPHLRDFMERVSHLFEIIVFTASQSIYAEQLLNVLDPKRKIFRHRVYRESCVFVEGNYLKDLSILGRDLARVIIVDNSPQAFGFQVDNGIPIESWFDDPTDQALLSLLPFLESLVQVEDVRPIIAERFNLRQKVAAAVNPSLSYNNDGLFKRRV